MPIRLEGALVLPCESSIVAASAAAAVLGLRDGLGCAVWIILSLVLSYIPVVEAANELCELVSSDTHPLRSTSAHIPKGSGARELGVGAVHTPVHVRLVPG
jgi:hypothetical protein